MKSAVALIFSDRIFVGCTLLSPSSQVQLSGSLPPHISFMSRSGLTRVSVLRSEPSAHVQMLGRHSLTISSRLSNVKGPSSGSSLLSQVHEVGSSPSQIVKECL